jgi:hypothetical protein
LNDIEEVVRYANLNSVVKVIEISEIPNGKNRGIYIYI